MASPDAYFEPVPHVFAGDLDLWVSWKSSLATHLGVDPYEIVLTGSGSVGFSLNPSKRWAPYHERSDIDVGVVSLHHFEVAWRYLRRTRTTWLSQPKSRQRALKSHRSNYVFAGTIATDKILSLLPFGNKWQAALDAMSQKQPTQHRDVKLRVYRDYDALRAYQADGIKKLRAKALSDATPDDDTPIEEDSTNARRN